MQPLGLFLHLLTRADYQLCRRRRCRRAQISHKINDREVGFVSDRRNHREHRAGHGARQPLMIERRQVLGRTAAPRDDDHFHIPGLVEVTNSRADFECSAFPLHLGGKNQHAGRAMPSAQDVQNVSQCSRLR